MSDISEHDADVVRLIGQHLISLGLKQTVDRLLEESGLNELDHPLATRLQHHVLQGEWDKASNVVEQLAELSGVANKDATINEMKLSIAEQKFYEFIDDDQRMKALKCLRLEITPRTDDDKKIQQLAMLLMCKSVADFRTRANFPGKGLESRKMLIEKFQHYIPPLIMLPPNRLSVLLSQAVQLQREKCNLHIGETDVGFKRADLKSDHVCSADKFPLQTRQTSESHRTEVWYCKFSNDGTKLATGGQGGNVKIWDLDPEEQRLTERCSLDCNTYSITCLSWSPNDVYLLACGSEERPDLWVWNVNKEEVHQKIDHSSDESTTTCSWHMSGEKFAAASLKGNFNIYDLDGNRRGTREGVRVQCLSFLHKDPDVVLAADNLNKLRSYAIKDMTFDSDEEVILEENNCIMSFTVDKSDKYIAVNVLEQGVHLWDLKLKTLLRMFPGVSQRNFTIYSSFSGQDPFLASGSENGNVYIYHLHKDQPVAILSGHSRCVNCVSWNPKFPDLLVSASDDRTIRLWAPIKCAVAHKTGHTN